MKKFISALLFVSILFTGCGAGKETNTDTEKTEEPAKQDSETGYGDEFEKKIITICKDHDVEYSMHSDKHLAPGLSDPNATSRFMLCDKQNGERDADLQIMTEYFEDAKYAEEQFQNNKTLISSPGSLKVLIDDDQTFASCLATTDYSCLTYIKLYDHYFITVVAIPEKYYDTGIEIMNDIEDLTRK